MKHKTALATSTSAEAAAPTKKGGSFFDNLPRNPDYEGYEAVVRYYLPTNDKV